MEVVAPLPCTEASGRAQRALLRMCGRWTDRYFFKNPILLLDPNQPPADILSDDNHEKSLVDITSWEEVKWDSIDGWTSEELKFTAMVSSEEGLVDNYNGSQVLHVEEHLSTVDPVVQMLLFASSCDPARTRSVSRKDECAFRCQKSMLLEEELGMDKKSFSSPITKQAPEVYTKRDAPRDGGDSFVQGSGDCFGVTTDADNQHGNGKNVERNQMFKQSKTCSGGSGSKPDDDIDNMQQQQQQQQQHVDSFGTGVDLWTSKVAPTHSIVNEDCLRDCHWETMIADMNLMNTPASMNCSNNSGCMTVSGMALNEQRSFKDTYQMPQRTDGAPVINFTEQKGELEIHSIFGSSITAQDSFNTDLKNAPAATATTWMVASAAPHHATGNRALLSNFNSEHSDIFLFGGDAGAMPMQVVGRGVVVTETMVLPDVWYVPGLVANLVSVSQLAELDYSVAFGRGKCYIRSTTDGAAVGVAHARDDGLFALDFLRVPLGL